MSAPDSQIYFAVGFVAAAFSVQSGDSLLHLPEGGVQKLQLNKAGKLCC